LHNYAIVAVSRDHDARSRGVRDCSEMRIGEYVFKRSKWDASFVGTCVKAVFHENTRAMTRLLVKPFYSKATNTVYLVQGNAIEKVQRLCHRVLHLNTSISGTRIKSSSDKSLVRCAM